MDFRMPPEVEEFRHEVREFLLAEWPDEMRKKMAAHSAEMYEIEREFRLKLAKKGWLALSWPKEYGGQGKTSLEVYVFYEEMAYFGARASNVAVGMVGPTLIRYGTDEQRARFLPKITSGEVEFALAYSEPDAGSDLASLQMPAMEDGDYFVVNGIKRWTSMAHRAEYCWLAARTDPTAPKHRGISVFIAEMNSPGVTIKPIETMGGMRTNETYWDNVRIPRENLVGEMNKGWYYIATALDFERVSAFAVGGFRSAFDRLVRTVQTTTHNGRALKDDPVVRQKIAQISIELEAAQMLSYRAAFLISEGKVPNYEASMLKTLSTEAQQRLFHAATDIFGLYGQLREGAPDAILDGELEREYRAMVMPTFGGGANELQRDIIATRGMGLPRG